MSASLAAASPSRRETVVLLHSSAGSARQWDGLADLLRPAFDVHCVEFHGHGRQAAWHGDRPLLLRDEALLAERLLEAADGGAHLVGHSYGAAVAVHLAANRPGLVRSLVAYEPVLFRLLLDHEPAGDATRQVLDLADAVRSGDPAAAAHTFVDHWSGAGSWRRLPAAAQQSVAARMAAVARHFDMMFAEPLPPARLSRLTMPVLCLQGECSTAAAQRIGALLRRLLPAACHELMPGLGHMAPVTQAAAVNTRIAAFLAAQASAVRTASSSRGALTIGQWPVAISTICQPG